MTGVIDFTFGGAITLPVTIAYQHEDFQDFASASLNQAFATAAAFPNTFKLTFGRVNPGSFVGSDTIKSFTDDGKGNIINISVPAATIVAGSIDYATGIFTITTALAFPGTFTVSAYTFNPFAGLIAPGGGQKIFDMFPGQLPELTVAPWAAGINGETTLALWGESRGNAGSVIITRWWHFGEEPFRVVAKYSGFLPGGESNDLSL
jgi:hypothetical protein